MKSKADDFTDVNRPTQRCGLLVFIIAQKATFQSTPTFITIFIEEVQLKGIKKVIRV